MITLVLSSVGPFRYFICLAGAYLLYDTSGHFGGEKGDVREQNIKIPGLDLSSGLGPYFYFTEILELLILP